MHRFEVVLKFYSPFFSERHMLSRSVCRLSVIFRLSSVTFVHPTQAIEIFVNFFYAIWYLGHPLTSM